MSAYRHHAMSAGEYADRVRFFRGFINMLAWFGAHVFLAVAGLYLLGIREEPAGGLFLVALAVFVLFYGLARRLSGTRVAYAVKHPLDEEGIEAGRRDR